MLVNIPYLVGHQCITAYLVVTVQLVDDTRHKMPETLGPATVTGTV